MSFNKSCHILTYKSGEVWNETLNKRAGHLSQADGYIRIWVNKKLSLAHRWVWEYFNGPVPEEMSIDHINGIRHDNRIDNLRLVTTAQNGINKRRRAHKKDSLKGACFYKGKYVSQIMYLGHNYHLGVFDTAEEAAKAYDTKAIELHGEFACLNFPKVISKSPDKDISTKKE